MYLHLNDEIVIIVKGQVYLLFTYVKGKMVFQYDDKVFLITGGSQGLGRGFADAVLTRGSRVAIADVADDVGKSTVKAFRERYGVDRAFYIHCDVSRQSDVANAWEKSERFFGREIDVLVNNAGINQTRGWRKCLEVNVNGVMHGSMLAVERMGDRPRGQRGGLIVNTASIASFLSAAFEDDVPYFTSKYAVLGLTRSIASGVAKDKNIRCVALCPFFANTSIINGDEDTMDFIREYWGENQVLSVDKVVDAFIRLIEDDEKNGDALCVYPHVSHFYWSPHPQCGIPKLLYFVAIAFLARLVGIRMVGWRTQVAFTILFIFMMYSFLKCPLSLLSGLF